MPGKCFYCGEELLYHEPVVIDGKPACQNCEYKIKSAPPVNVSGKEAIITKKKKKHPVVISILIIFLLLFMSYGGMRFYYDIYLPLRLDRLHVIVKMDEASLLKSLAKNTNEQFHMTLKQTAEEIRGTNLDIVDKFAKKLRDSGIDLTRYYGNSNRRYEEKNIQFLQQQIKLAQHKATEIIRKRLDQYGIIGIEVEQLQDKRIRIEFSIYGEIQVASAALKKLLRPSKLEFRLLIDEEFSTDVFNEMIIFLNELRGEAGLSESQMATGDPLYPENLFYSHPTDQSSLLVANENLSKFEAFLDIPAVKDRITRKIAGVEFLRASRSVGDEQFWQVYLVRKNPELADAAITEADVKTSKQKDPSNVGNYEITFTFDAEAARIFSRITGANIGKRLAIVLDSRVLMAPKISTKIPDGRARITGLQTIKEAYNLSIVFKTGALPAPLIILEEKIIKKGNN